MNRLLASSLSKALKKVKITKVSKLPILNHARLEFINGELIITSTDLEKVFQDKCSCILEEEWSTCVPMQNRIDISTTHNPVWRKIYSFLDFIEICAEYDDVLEFTFDPKIQVIEIKVQNERSITKFKCLDAMEFPSIGKLVV